MPIQTISDAERAKKRKSAGRALKNPPAKHFARSMEMPVVKCKNADKPNFEICCDGDTENGRTICDGCRNKLKVNRRFGAELAALRNQL